MKLYDLLLRIKDVKRGTYFRLFPKRLTEYKLKLLTANIP